MKVFLAILTVVALSSAFASAAVVEDFENWTGAGAVVSDPDNAANSVLALASGQSVDIPLGADTGVVTIDVYDFGEGAVHPTNQYGPRWAIEGISDVDGAAISVGAGIIFRNYMNGNTGYAMSYETTRTSAWYSPSWFAGPRQATMENWLDTNADDILDADQNDGAGQWTTWTIEAKDDGTAAITGPFGENGATSTTKTTWWNGDPVLMTNMNKVWLSGGGSGLLAVVSGPYAGKTVLFDNVTLSSGQTAIPGDANMDNAVNIQDFIILKQNYGTATGATWGQGDFNGDGAVNIQDFIILKQNYGTSV